MPYNPDTEENVKPTRQGSTGFRPYLQKARLAYSLVPETKFNMARTAAGGKNQLLRARIGADYGLNMDLQGKYKNRYF